jgi:hypothetical protein
MKSHLLGGTGWVSASPLAEGERIEVRGSFEFTTNVPNPHPTLSALRPVAIPGEANLSR